MATLEISIVPLGTASTSVSAFVVGCHEVLATHFPDLKTELGAMGTNLEGPLDRLLEAVRAIHEVPFSQGVQRVYTVIKIDDRRDKESSLASKVASAQNKLA